jgi:multidrug efflux pump subunit AcrB
MVNNLENSIITGVILVTLVLMFFMGLRNALFVGIAIPLSMFMAFMVLSAIGYSANMMVLFGLILALVCSSITVLWWWKIFTGSCRRVTAQ